jgi:hypothetical protein
MESSLIINTSSDVWSLGCMISILFTYLDDGAHGVARYAERRAAHTTADGRCQFFIQGRQRKPSTSSGDQAVAQQAYQKSKEPKQG